MSNDNQVHLAGNATREPELKYLPNGSAVATFGLAVNRRYQDKTTKEWQEKTSFFDVSAYGAQAENVSQSVPRGARVTVTGSLEQRSWETQEGDKRSKIEIKADEVSVSLKWANAQIEKTERTASKAASNEGSGFEPF